MSKASGVVLVLAGLAAAVYVLPSGGDMGEPDFGQFTEAVKAPAPSPNRIALVAEPRLAARPTSPAAEPVPGFSAPVVVTIAQRPNDPPQKSAPLPRDRDAIGRELQKELKRVGCYEGELNGMWTPATRQAVKAFTDRVNASLPTEEPDGIVLAMVRGYQDKVCGKPCPSGQGLGEGGRCVPNAILVRSTRQPSTPVVAVAPAAPKTPSAITAWTTTVAPAPTPPVGVAPNEGRMALAGPVAEPTPAAQPPAATPPTPEKAARRVEQRPKGQGSWAQNFFKSAGTLN